MRLQVDQQLLEGVLFPKLLHHRSESAGEDPDLSAAGLWKLDVQTPVADHFCALGQLAERVRDATSKEV